MSIPTSPRGEPIQQGRTSPDTTRDVAQPAGPPSLPAAASQNASVMPVIDTRSSADSEALRASQRTALQPVAGQRPSGDRSLGATDSNEGEGEESATDVTQAVIESAPPWLVSMVVHMLLLLVLAFWYLEPWLPNRIDLDAVFSDEVGMQLIEDTLELPSLEPIELTDTAVSIDEAEVDDPLAAAPDVPVQVPEALRSSSPKETPSIGLALSGRSKGRKQVLLNAYGGTEITESAVRMALEWLARNQRPDGSWSMMGPYQNGLPNENRLAATSMALLAFQGAGYTVDSGKYGKRVARAWEHLLRLQDADGNFFQNGISSHRLYSQAQATIAICELYGMTKDEAFRDPAQLAIDYALKVQAPEGGWRYVPGQGTDTSVTGWFVMGLQSALMAGLEVPSPALDRISEYLDLVTTDGGSNYAYRVNNGARISMTAEALLCRQYLGWAKEDPRLGRGVAEILRNPIDWERSTNVYYWYYATQVVHHMEGKVWQEWNKVMRDSLPRRQVQAGREKGSWEPTGDRWGHQGGRLYMTCLCTYMLEVYYRHLPIYKYRVQ
ncbi:MAG: prenyltransferase/squalene oxidase repeat-containing protein [Planctomycetota bacterium]|nr:prenyltransferase/squalene oxidase repeat-containing protein [Planctomycetota bacterium]